MPRPGPDDAGIKFSARRPAGKVLVLYGAQRQWADNVDLSRAYPDRFPMGDLYDFDGVTVRVPARQRQRYHGDTSSGQADVDVLLGEQLQLGYNGSHFRHPTTTGDLSSCVDYGGNWSTDIHTVYGRYRFDWSERLWGEAMANCARYEVAPESSLINRFSGFAPGYKYAESQRRQAELVLHRQWQDRQTLTGGRWPGRSQSFFMFVPNPALGPEQVKTWQLDYQALLSAEGKGCSSEYRRWFRRCRPGSANARR